MDKNGRFKYEYDIGNIIDFLIKIDLFFWRRKIKKIRIKFNLTFDNIYFLIFKSKGFIFLKILMKF